MKLQNSQKRSETRGISCVRIFSCSSSSRCTVCEFGIQLRPPSFEGSHRFQVACIKLLIELHTLEIAQLHEAPASLLSRLRHDRSGKTAKHSHLCQLHINIHLASIMARIHMAVFVMMFVVRSTIYASRVLPQRDCSSLRPTAR